MFIIENGHHVLFEDEGVCPEVLALIRLYLEDQIVLRSETPMPEKARKLHPAEQGMSRVFSKSVLGLPEKIRLLFSNDFKIITFL